MERKTHSGLLWATRPKEEEEAQAEEVKWNKLGGESCSDADISDLKT